MSVALRTPVGPRPYPLLGNLPDILRHSTGFFLSTRARYGDTFRYRLAGREIVFAAHPDDVQHVLQGNATNYRKHSLYAKVKPLVGEGLLTSEGETWLRNRRLAQPVFHRQRVAGFGELMSRAAEQMLTRRWSQYGYAAFDLMPEMMRLTLAIVAEALFSADISQDADIVGEALTFALKHTDRRTMAPFDLPLPTPNMWRYRRAIETLDAVVYGFIADRRTQVAASGSYGDDLLGMLLAAQDAETGERMSDREVRDEAMTLFLAGHETTAVALTWAFWFLAQRPEVREAVETEVDAVLVGRAPTVDDAPRLELTRRVIDETLRLYPPAWIIGRQAVRDDALRGVRVASGRDVSLSPFVTHRHPEFWEDPERFDPDRFTPARSEGRPRFAYFPFGGGPRLCIGNNFALLEMTLVLASVTQRYRLELLPGQTIKPLAQLTLRPSRPVMVRTVARE